MYLYIYDSFLHKTGHETTLSKIETRLVDLGISGDIERFTPLRSLEELLRVGSKKGCKTVVVVGSDKLLSQVLSTIPKYPSLSLGFIPIDEKSRLAALLGIPPREKACDILSSRIMRTMDLGKVNNSYFFSSLETSDQNCVIECDSRYHVRLSRAVAKVSICNTGNVLTADTLDTAAVRNPADGLLEVIVHSARESGLSRLFGRRGRGGGGGQNSVFQGRKFSVSDSQKSATWLADGVTVHKTPFQVEIIPRKLKIIVGKDRLFE